MLVTLYYLVAPFLLSKHRIYSTYFSPIHLKTEKRAYSKYPHTIILSSSWPMPEKKPSL